MTKAQRALESAKASNRSADPEHAAAAAQAAGPGAAISRWLWLRDANSRLPPDKLTYTEFKRLLVRIQTMHDSDLPTVLIF